MKKKAYAGIGSRRTPKPILDMMTQVATKLEALGFMLYSGGAPGADLAFEKGVLHSENKKIFIPKAGFNNSTSSLYNLDERTFPIAAQHHIHWNKMKPYTKNLMARNVHQILGENLDEPISFVLCYTPDGCESHKTRSYESGGTGGTGLAISVASSLGIPVFNLANNDTYNRISKFLESGSKGLFLS